MKKQLIIKKNRDNLQKDVRDVLILIKNINKNAVFFTKNNIILNPIIVFGDKFFVIQIGYDYYKIITRKQEWRIPSYATQNIDKIHKLMQQRIKKDNKSFNIILKQKSIEYIIPLNRIVYNYDSKYYRMNFHQIYKQTQKKISCNYYVQQNGRQIKPIFVSKDISSFVSTSPILEVSVQYNKITKNFTYIISNYSIDTITGQITKAVQRAFQNSPDRDYGSILNELINKRTKEIKNVVKN